MECDSEWVSPQHRNVNMFPERKKKLASRDIISGSTLILDTAVCFLHIQEIESIVCDPKPHNTPPEVDLGILQISAKEAS